MEHQQMQDILEKQIVPTEMAANGGRIGYEGGQLVKPPGITAEE